MEDGELVAYVYYYFDIKLTWGVRSDLAEINSSGDIIILSKSLVSINKTKSIIGYIIYSTEPLLDNVIHHKTARPRLIKYYDIIELEKSDPQTNWYPFGIPNLIYCSNAGSEHIYQHHIVDLEKNWKDMFQFMKNNLNELGSFSGFVDLEENELKRKLYTYDFNR